MTKKKAVKKKAPAKKRPPKKKTTKGKEEIARMKALAAARYFGAECQANPGTSFSDYASDIALRYGKGKKWSDLTKEEMAAARAAFSQGREEERALQGGSV